jgi:hypothetical protein
MDANALIAFLGHTNGNSNFKALLGSNGISSELAIKKLKSEGMAHIEAKALGLEMVFDEIDGFRRKRREPNEDGGEGVLSGVVFYPNGSKSYSEFVGSTPFGLKDMKTRDEFHRIFGSPLKTEDDDGQLEWEQWLRDGKQIRATYREDGTIKLVSISIPLK